MLGSNPALIQTAPRNQLDAKPLVLIHDGGGTVFGYYSLGKLNRDVYAIFNPKFDKDTVWEGGMSEMAEAYAKLLVDAGLKGPIYLGGWSLGALISIEVANILASRTKIADRDNTTSTSTITVLGLLLIDMPIHIPWNLHPPVAPFQLPSTVPEGIRRCMGQVQDLIQFWQLPTWQPPPLDKERQPQRVVYTGFSRRPIFIPPGQVYYQSSTGSGTVIRLDGDSDTPSYLAEGIAKCNKRKSGDPAFSDATGIPTPIGPPTAVLVRCTELVPVASSSGEHATQRVRIDLQRDSRSLGWHLHHPEFVAAVIDVEANHYNMFDFEKVDVLTSKIVQAIKLLGG